MNLRRKSGLVARGKEDLAISVVDIGAPTASADLSMLCGRLAWLLERFDTNVLVCDVGGLVVRDAATLDALARLQLTARRLGCKVRLTNASDELHGLLALVGLCDIVGLCAPHGSLSQNPILRDRGAAEGRRAGTSGRCRGRR